MSQVVVIFSVVMRKRREEGRRNLVWCLGLPFLDDWLYLGTNYFGQGKRSSFGTLEFWREEGWMSMA